MEAKGEGKKTQLLPVGPDTGTVKLLKRYQNFVHSVWYRTEPNLELAGQMECGHPVVSVPFQAKEQ